jgi:hypothetical protein
MPLVQVDQGLNCPQFQIEQDYDNLKSFFVQQFQLFSEGENVSKQCTNRTLHQQSI